MNEYQHHVGRTAIYPGASTGSVSDISYVVLGLSGETGEVADKLKKIIRDDEGKITDSHRASLMTELGDVLWYAARLASELEVELSDVARMNVGKLRRRALDGTLRGSGDNR